MVSTPWGWLWSLFSPEDRTPPGCVSGPRPVSDSSCSLCSLSRFEFRSPAPASQHRPDTLYLHLHPGRTAFTVVGVQVTRGPAELVYYLSSGKRRDSSPPPARVSWGRERAKERESESESERERTLNSRCTPVRLSPPLEKTRAGHHFLRRGHHFLWRGHQRRDSQENTCSISRYLAQGPENPGPRPLDPDPWTQGSGSPLT